MKEVIFVNCVLYLVYGYKCDWGGCVIVYNVFL